MAKRTFWFGMGAALGAAGGVWTKVKVDRKLAASSPARIGLEALSWTRKSAKTAVTALRAGRQEAGATKARLKIELIERPKPQTSPGVATVPGKTPGMGPGSPPPSITR